MAWNACLLTLTERTNDRFLSKIHASTQPSKILILQYTSSRCKIWKKVLLFCTRQDYQMNEIHTKLRHSLSILYMKLKFVRIIVLHQTWNSVILYLHVSLLNCVNVCSIHFHHVHSLLLGECSSLSEHIVIFGHFWRPLSLSAVGRHLVRLMAAPALHMPMQICLCRLCICRSDMFREIFFPVGV